MITRRSFIKSIGKGLALCGLAPLIPVVAKGVVAESAALTTGTGLETLYGKSLIPEIWNDKCLKELYWGCIADELRHSPRINKRYKKVLDRVEIRRIPGISIK